MFNTKKAWSSEGSFFCEKGGGKLDAQFISHKDLVQY